VTQQTTPRPWFEDFFHGLATELWRRVASPEMTAAETAFLVHELRLRAGSRVLDVPCGFGRHALALAADPGCDVDGVDISQEYVAEAQAAAARHDGPGRVRVRRGDIREVAEHRFGDLLMRIENRYDPLASRLDGVMTFEQGDTVQRATASHHVHTVGELLWMLRAAGLEPLAAYAAPDRTPYALGCPRLLVVARRHPYPCQHPGA
jgi:SAM-dependent methyltransferase